MKSLLHIFKTKKLEIEKDWGGPLITFLLSIVFYDSAIYQTVLWRNIYSYNYNTIVNLLIASNAVCLLTHFNTF